jgi:hypothetical protein
MYDASSIVLLRFVATHTESIDEYVCSSSDYPSSVVLLCFFFFAMRTESIYKYIWFVHCIVIDCLARIYCHAPRVNQWVYGQFIAMHTKSINECMLCTMHCWLFCKSFLQCIYNWSTSVLSIRCIVDHVPSSWDYPASYNAAYLGDQLALVNSSIHACLIHMHQSNVACMHRQAAS